MAIVLYAGLMTDLGNSAFLTGVSLGFGEEEIGMTHKAMPYVCVVPRGGPVEPGPGYVHDLDKATNFISETADSIDVYMWAKAASASAKNYEHADAVIDLRRRVESAFQDQRCRAESDGTPIPGLQWKPFAWRWEMHEQQINRLGRAGVLTLIAKVSLPSEVPSGEATITTITQSVSVTTPQHV